MRGGELRRAEGGKDVLGGAFILRQEVGGLFLRDDDDRDEPPRNMSTPATAKPVVRFSMKYAPIMVPIGAPMVEPAP